MTDNNEQDFTNESYVLGAVLAQLEDLPLEEQSQVLYLALAAIETAQEVEDEYTRPTQ